MSGGGKLRPVSADLGGMVGTGTRGGSFFSVSRRSPPVPVEYRKALGMFREALSDVWEAAAPGGFSFWRSALGRLGNLAALLALYPDPADAAELLGIVRGSNLLPEQAAVLLPLAEPLAELCPRDPLGINAEAEAVRLELLEQLGELERNAAGKVWAFHAGGLRRHAPRFRELLEGLPASAYPHGDASRLAEVSRKLSNGGGFHAAWPLEDGAERLAVLTAPEPPHTPEAVPVPAFRCLLEPDPPLAWEGRAEVRGTWYGGGWWKGPGGKPTEAEPLAGVAWHITGGPFRETSERVPVLFPLPLRRSDLSCWRGWVPAPE